jgi:23S rRNA pseudouridine1911/1915/1917 synthase
MLPGPPEAPAVLAETEAYAVVYKPPRMHSAPLAKNAGEGGTLVHWYAGSCPAALALRGRRAGEGGLLHRLDYETRGLVLFAKTQDALDALTFQQERGLFTKEYGALCGKGPLPGGTVPPAPERGEPPFTLESAFRPFGPGRREVRPAAFPPAGRQRKAAALDRGGPYVTEVLEQVPLPGGLVYFRLGIRRGFRHQIRCHLAWLGFPILNDGLYGAGGEGLLALKAQGLAFFDPQSGEGRRYGLEPLLHEV